MFLVKFQQIQYAGRCLGLATVNLDQGFLIGPQTDYLVGHLTFMQAQPHDFLEKLAVPPSSFPHLITSLIS